MSCTLQVQRMGEEGHLLVSILIVTSPWQIKRFLCPASVGKRTAAYAMQGGNQCVLRKRTAAYAVQGGNQCVLRKCVSGQWGSRGP